MAGGREKDASDTEGDETKITRDEAARGKVAVPRPRRSHPGDLMSLKDGVTDRNPVGRWREGVHEKVQQAITAMCERRVT